MMDVYDMWRLEENRKEEWLVRRPTCRCCGEHIQEVRALHYNGDWYCEGCEEELWNEFKEEHMECIEEM